MVQGIFFLFKYPTTSLYHSTRSSSLLLSMYTPNSPQKTGTFRRSLNFAAMLIRRLTPSAVASFSYSANDFSAQVPFKDTGMAGILPARYGNEIPETGPNDGV